MKQSGYHKDSNMNKKIIFVNEKRLDHNIAGFFAFEKLDGTTHI